MLQLGLVVLAAIVLLDVLAEHWRRARARGLVDREAERSRRALMTELRRQARDGS